MVYWCQFGKLTNTLRNINTTVEIPYYTRYNFLNKYIGSSTRTEISLLKCFFDQVVFATQVDTVFLGLCAYDHTGKLHSAIDEVKRSFLTTWIIDCSIWPACNFFGFCLVPVQFQPAYMSLVSFFWQIFMSFTAGNANEITDRIEKQERSLEALRTSAQQVRLPQQKFSPSSQWCTFHM